MTKVLIIGGGIAGSVTAIALRKAGIDSVVHEAYDRSAEGVGAYLTLAVNGLDALRTLDLDEVVQGEGFDTPRIALFLGSGRRLADMSLGTLADGTLARTVKRARLYRALRDEAARRGVRIEHGKRLVGADSTSEGVIARFADGTQAEGDLLVGADGLHSTTRRIIDPAAPDARYVGLLNTGGYARGVSVDAQPGVLNVVFGKRCFFCYFLAHACLRRSAQLQHNHLSVKHRPQCRRRGPAKRSPDRQGRDASDQLRRPAGACNWRVGPECRRTWHR